MSNPRTFEGLPTEIQLQIYDDLIEICTRGPTHGQNEDWPIRRVSKSIKADFDVQYRNHLKRYRKYVEKHLDAVQNKIKNSSQSPDCTSPGHDFCWHSKQSQVDGLAFCIDFDLRNIYTLHIKLRLDPMHPSVRYHGVWREILYGAADRLLYQILAIDVSSITIESDGDISAGCHVLKIENILLHLGRFKDQFRFSRVTYRCPANGHSHLSWGSRDFRGQWRRSDHQENRMIVTTWHMIIE